MNIDVTALDDSQLTALAIIDPAAARQERRRRSAFSTLEEGLTALAQASFDLAHVVENIKQTTATKAVKDTGILSIVDRLLVTAQVNNIDYQHAK